MTAPNLHDQPEATVYRLRPANEFSDLGNARRLLEAHGQDLRFDHSAGRWLVWDGRRWAEDATGEAARRAKDVATMLLSEAANTADEVHKKAATKHALQSMNVGRLKAMLEVAETEPGVPILVDELDANPWVLNVANGLLDLRTGRLGDHQRHELCTKLAPVDYDPDAQAPVFERFLHRIFDGDQELIDFIQRLFGYALTGSTRDQVFPVFHGAGANGKSTLVELLRHLLGDYAVTMPPDLLIQRRGGSTQPHGLVQLRGARFVTASETDDGARLSVALVKQITGGDTITARRLYGEFFDFRPIAKFVLSTNHKPIIADTTESVWRRVLLVPFAVTIPAAERDSTLPAQLREELRGILAWAVRGCLDWQAFGLGRPAAVHDATSEYRDDSNPLAAFFEERCLLGPNWHVRSNDLFAAWQAWSNRRGEQAGTASTFGTRLKEKGYTARRGAKGARFYDGIALAEDDDEGVTG